jgi:hypothetical protein
MSDMSGHDATERDTLHTLTLRDLEAVVATAGVLISRRQLMRHCEAGTFDAKKLPATNNVEEWFIAPASVEKGIADIKTLQEQRARRDASRPDMSGYDAAKELKEIDTVTSRYDASRPSASEPINQDATHPDVTGHVRSQPDMSERQQSQKEKAIEPVTSRHSATDLDVYEHPYVKKLEDRVEKLEAKYEAQVRRTEEIQLNSQHQLIELQRMTAIGQSETLGNFMLKAREWWQGNEPEKRETEAPTG